MSEVASVPPTGGGDRVRRRVAVVIRARLLTTVVDTATGILVVRLLSKSEVAVLMLLLLVHETLKQVATLGLPESVLYFFEKWGGEHRRSLALRTVGLVACNALVAAAIMLGLAVSAPVWLSQWAPEHVDAVQRYMPFVALMAVCELPTWPTTNVLIGLHRPALAGRYEIVTSALLLSAIVLPAALGQGLPGVMLGLLTYGGARLLGSAALLAWQLPRANQRPLHRGALSEQARFAIPLGLSALSGRLNKYLDRGVVALLLPAAAFAEYTVATTEIPLVNAFPYGAASVLIGHYVQLWEARQLGDLSALWHRAVRTIGLLVVPVGVLLICMAPDLIVFVFGAQYRSAVPPFQIFCGIVLLRVANYGALVQAFGRTRVVLHITLTVLVANLALNVPLTLAFGVTGTASATLLASLLGLVLFLRVIARHLEVTWWRAGPLRAYLHTVAAAAAGGLLALGVRHSAPLSGAEPLTGCLVIGSVGVLGYLAIGAATGLIRRRDVEVLLLLARA